MMNEGGGATYPKGEKEMKRSVALLMVFVVAFMCFGGSGFADDQINDSKFQPTQTGYYTIQISRDTTSPSVKEYIGIALW